MTSTGASLSAMSLMQQQISLISGDLASVNSTGYKGFDLLSVSINNAGGTGSSGITSVVRNNISVQGDLEQTNIATDLAITGKGAIPVASVDSSGNILGTFFTFGGSFRQTSAGNFETPTNYNMLAWPLDADGNLPSTKSLLSSLNIVNVDSLIAEASSTTSVTIGASLNSSQQTVGGGQGTIDITEVSSDSPHNMNILSTDLLYANPNNSMTKGEGIEILLADASGDATRYIMRYEGFASSGTFVNASTDLVGTSSDNIQITVDSVTTTVTRGAGTTNLAVLENIASQINATATNSSAGALRARLVNIGTSTQLYVAPVDIDYAMAFVCTTAFGSELGITSSQNTTAYTAVSGSANVGRFASLSDLAAVLDDLGLITTVNDEDSIGASITFASTYSAYFANYDDLGGGSDFLTEFGLPNGYLQSSYDPYDSNNNMAGGGFSPQFSQNFTLIDAYGDSYNMVISYLKTDTNIWAAEVYAVNSADVNTTGRYDGLIAASTLTFDTSGLKSIAGTYQTAKSSDILTSNTALGATLGQTLTMTVNGASTTYNYGSMTNDTNSFAYLGTVLAADGTQSAGDFVNVTCGSTSYQFFRGTGTTDYAVLMYLQQQINSTSGTDGLHAEILYDSSSTSYRLNIKALTSTNAVSYSQPTANSKITTAYTTSGTGLGTSLAANANVNATNFTVSDANAHSVTINLYTIEQALTAGTTTNGTVLQSISTLFNTNAALAGSYFTSSVVTDSGNSYLVIQSTTATTGDEQAAATAGLFTITDASGVLSAVLAPAGNYGLGLGLTDIVTATFNPALTTGTGAVLFPGTAKVFDVKVGTHLITVTTLTTNTTDGEVLSDIASQINNSAYGSAVSGGVTATVETNGNTGYEYLVITPNTIVPPTSSVPVIYTYGPLASVLLPSVEYNIAANSFETLLDLSEQVNNTTGADSVIADVVPGTNSAEYKIIFKPATSSYYITFGGSVATVGGNIGNNTSTTIFEAMGLSSTTAAKQLTSLANTITVNWAHNIGVTANTITMDIGSIGSKTGVFQASGISYALKNEQNGVSAGNLSGIQIDNYGKIIASFSNGNTRALYQIPIADFANIDGLQINDGTTYSVSKDSGPLILKEAATQGAGIFSSGALANSNVDMSTEIVNMIQINQAYQANGKALKVSLDLDDYLINRILS